MEKGMFSEKAASILSDLVAINSVNPNFPGGDDGESGMVKYIADFFDRSGIEYRTEEVLPVGGT